MSWGTPQGIRSGLGITCCYCGRRAPQDAELLVRVGWQVRPDYPVRYRCGRCRRRFEREAA